MRPVFIVIILLVSSCCKVGCIYESMELQFEGYHWEELDSTLIKRYEPNTNFTVLIDSFYRNSAVTGGDGNIFLEHAMDHLDLTKDFTVTVQVSHRTYNISAIATDRFSCPCESKRGKKISSYVLDGVRVYGQQVVLKR